MSVICSERSCREVNPDHRSTCKRCSRPLPSCRSDSADTDDAASSTGQGIIGIAIDLIGDIADALPDLDL